MMMTYLMSAYEIVYHIRSFKIALKMLGKIASQLVHSENESCIQPKAIMTVFTF